MAISMRLYGGVWRYASLNDLLAITKSASLVILIFLPMMFLLNLLEWIPRPTPIITWYVLLGLLGGPPFLYRLFKDRQTGRAAGGEGARRVAELEDRSDRQRRTLQELAVAAEALAKDNVVSSLYCIPVRAN